MNKEYIEHIIGQIVTMFCYHILDSNGQFSSDPSSKGTNLVERTTPLPLSAIPTMQVVGGGGWGICKKSFAWY